MPGDFSDILFHELDIQELSLLGIFDTLNVSCKTEANPRDPRRS